MGGFIYTPYDIIHKDFMDFMDHEKTIWMQNEYGIKVNNEQIESFSSSFQEICKYNHTHKDSLIITTTHSYLRLEKNIIYKYLIKTNNNKILEKFETDQISNRLRYFINTDLIKEYNTKLVIYNENNPTFLYKSKNKEYLSILYDEEMYFEILKSKKRDSLSG